jgi:hypothetical protein
MQKRLHSAVRRSSEHTRETNLIYWVDAYDALICYKTVTPLKE